MGLNWRFQLLPLILAALAHPVNAGLPVVEWERTVLPDAYPGIYPGPGVQGVRSTGVDAAGNLFVVVNGSGTTCAFTVKLTAATGDVAWRRELCEATWTTLGVDAQGNVLSAGRTGNRLTVVKYANASGEVLWHRDIPPESADAMWFGPMGIAVDSSGNAFLAGYQDRPERRGYLYKLAAADGTIGWRRDAGASIGGVAVGANAEVFVGSALGITRLRGADGVADWNQPSAGGRPLAVHPSGDLIVASTSYVPGERPGEFKSWTLSTTRLDRVTGAVRWRIDRSTTDETRYMSAAANALAIDTRGDVFVTGALTQDMFTMKVSGENGVAIWEARRPPVFQGFHFAWGAGIAVDSAGDALVTGVSDMDNSTALPFGDVRTVKYSGSTGAVMWSAGYGGTTGFFEAGWDAVSSGNAAYVVATKRIAGLGDALRVWKYGSGSLPAPNAHGLWWVSPAASENGSGLFVSHQADVLFALWFSYDIDGSPLWIAMPALRQWRDDTYLGYAYLVTGPFFGGAFDSAAVNATQTGRAQLTLNADGTANVEFPDRRGQVLRKTVTRQLFASPVPECGDGDATSASTNYQDLWWSAPAGSESGWGLSLAHQGDTLFGLWYTYGSNGKPLWYVAPNLAKTGPRTYAGTLFRTRGPAYDAQPWNPQQVLVVPVGNATVSFSDGINGRFTYSADGIDGSKAITRQLFALPASVCR